MVSGDTVGLEIQLYLLRVLQGRSDGRTHGIGRKATLQIAPGNFSFVTSSQYQAHRINPVYHLFLSLNLLNTDKYEGHEDVSDMDSFLLPGLDSILLT